MQLKSKNLLFFTRSMKLGGTENVILQLCEILKGKVNNIVVCSMGGVNVEKLTEMGIKHYEIPDIENKNPKCLIKVMSTLKKIVKVEEIDIIHTHHRMAAFYVSMMGLYRKCTFLNTSHNTFSDKKALTKWAYQNAKIAACGEMVKKNLVDFYGLNENQVVAITNSVKTFDGIVESDELISNKKKEEYFVVGNVGRLSEQKGMEYYIKAIPKVIAFNDRVHFLVVGEGEDRAKLEELVKELHIENKISFMGYRADAMNLMAQMDLVVLSSLWEGYPLTPIEAFAVGKTIIATAVDGTVEIVKDGYNGYLINPRSEKEIADKILAIVNDKSKLEELEKNAKKTYDEDLSYEKFAEKYIKFYEECINERTSKESW